MHSLCRSACVKWRWQTLVLLDFARMDKPDILSGSSLALALGGPADGGSGSCSTERGICFTLW